YARHSAQKYSWRKLHIFSVGVRGHLPTVCPISLQQSTCLQPHTLGSTDSLTQASSARIFSMFERFRGTSLLRLHQSLFQDGHADSSDSPQAVLRSAPNLRYIAPLLLGSPRSDTCDSR